MVLAADTREQVAELNAAIQRELIALGRVDHQHTVTTGAGERIGVGDRVATRRNDPALGVANRDTWTVTTVHPDGSLAVTGRCGDRILPATYVARRVELAYATTVHGAQGDTAQTGHLVVGDHTTAQAAYVGMTRGRKTTPPTSSRRTLDRAREQWIAVFDRHPLRPRTRRRDASRPAAEAANYAPQRPLDEVCGDLWDAWTRQAACHEIITREQRLRQRVTAAVQVTARRDRVLQPLRTRWLDAAHQVAAAEDHLHHIDTAIATRPSTITADLHSRVAAQRPEARRAGETVLAGGRCVRPPQPAGRPGRRLPRPGGRRTWQPAIGALPDTLGRLARLATGTDHPERLHDALAAHAHQLAEHAHPERGDAHQAITRADAVRDRAQTPTCKPPRPTTADSADRLHPRCCAAPSRDAPRPPTQPRPPAPAWTRPAPT